MGRSRTRRYQDRKVKKSNKLVSNEQDLDRSNIIMDWVLMHTIILDSNRPNVQQLFTLVDYLTEKYHGSELNRVVILRAYRQYFVARISAAGNPCECITITTNNDIIPNWNILHTSWDSSRSIIENLVVIRFGEIGSAEWNRGNRICI